MYDLLSWFVQPYPLLLMALGVAILRLRRPCQEHRNRWRIALGAYVALCISSTPAVSHVAMRFVESGYPQRVVTPTNGDVIIVLTGNFLRADARRPYDEPGDSSLFRCYHVARIYRLRRCPIIVTGGTPDPSVPGPSNAAIMRDCLLEVGIRAEDVQIEERSRNTAESGRECTLMLKELAAKRVILVTEAFHMRRTMLSFANIGVPLEPASCAMRSGEFRWTVRNFLPSASALSSLQLSSHEIVGLIWYRLRGSGQR
ncbi:MAG: YdcF family protein [Planctomycetia bacterium]|nr:YdcF family protein [Planctomycetia bacterium]